jgi:hypothetical protein
MIIGSREQHPTTEPAFFWVGAGSGELCASALSTPGEPSIKYKPTAVSGIAAMASVTGAPGLSLAALRGNATKLTATVSIIVAIPQNRMVMASPAS